MKRRSGLGRGLDALLPGENTTVLERAGVGQVPIDAIEPNPQQPRRSFDEETITELATSIAELGILQPLLVRSTGDGGFALIAGERRLRAARRAGQTSVPVVVVDTDETGSLERALVENVHREDLNPLEEAAAYRQLLDDAGLTQEALAGRLGRSRVTITNMLRLLELPLGVQRLLTERRLSAAHGKALLGLQGNPFMERLARRAAEEGMSVRDTEDAVRRYRSMTETGSSHERRARTQNAAAQEAQRTLADVLQARVRVQMGSRKGKIVVEFVSEEELQRLVAVISGTAERGRPTTVAPG